MLDYQLLSPEEEVEEIYPYRRVWASLIVELGLLSLIMMGIFVVVSFGIATFRFSLALEVALCIIPLALFYVFSVRRERRTIQSRQGLLMLLVVGMVVANGVSFPIIDGIITPEEWLTESGFFDRLIGYTLTTGVVVAFTHYVVLRYTIWPERFRVRVDGIAYSVPVALGYASVANLRFVLSEEPTVDALAGRVLVNVLFYVAIAAVMGYFLAELAIGKVPIFWLSLGLFITAFLGSAFVAFRRIAVVSGLASRDIGPLALAIAFAFVLLYSLSFLIESADARMAAREGIRRIR